MNMWASEGHYSFQLAPDHYVGIEIILDGDLLLEKLEDTDLLPPDLQRFVARTPFPVQIRTNRLSPVASEAILREQLGN